MGRRVHIEEAATYVGSTVNTLRFWKHRGEGPQSFKIGGRVVYDTDDLDAYIELCRAATITGGKVPAQRESGRK